MNRNTSKTCIERYSLSVAIHGLNLRRASDGQLASNNKGLEPVSNILHVLLNPTIAAICIDDDLLPY